ncbi:alkaline phosphatase-like [Macrobrachium rosenbergii]|uniref:alkaline phosphatase-like n=1 Tax=Macrobrachium rosenbergii TaxID=79674 RepID=UPI0034D5C441
MASLGILAVVVVLATGFGTATVFPRPSEDENDSDYWLKLGREEIEEALLKPKLTNVAKNVILFLGDGMGITVSTAGRIYKGQKHGHSGEEGNLVWDKFPSLGLLKTYDLDMQVPDSASTATAFLCGVKANYRTVGVNGRVRYCDCQASLIEENRLTSIIQWAQEAKKDTGFITTTQVTHATVAAAYAKSASRKWQCDKKMKKFGQSATACKDIARQLVEDVPGKHIKVVMGGGRQEMGAPKTDIMEDNCKRTDGMNLVRDWISHKEENDKSYAYVTTTRELRSVDTNNTEYILGLFDDIHLPYETDRDTSLDGCPHIKEMVEVAINRLKNSDNGFFLLAEGGKIDKGLHITSPKRALEELLAFEEAVELALKMVDMEETLVIVTADHSHVMTMNGYPPRGNDILGVVTESEEISDGLPFTTLTFANGHGFNYSFDGNKVVRPNLTGVDTTDKEYVSLAAMPTYYDSETHGGEDVAAFAVGPWAHLFHRVHEQTYIAHVMAYASCIGPYKDCHHHHAERPFNEYNILQKQVKEHPKRVSSSATGLLSGNIFIFMIAAKIFLF